jgi:TRAP-type C4-dicarboxylate transport system permease small subunit
VRQVVTFGEALLALMLATLLAMVLLNIVMRYGFGTGFSSTEELSRTLFVWITFSGAVLAAYERTHLGIDSLLDRLPPGPRRAGQVLSEGIVLACCLLVLHGTWRQHGVNATNKSLTTGMPMIWVYGIGYVVSIGIGLITAWRIWTLVSPRAGAGPGDAEPGGAAR